MSTLPHPALTRAAALASTPAPAAAQTPAAIRFAAAADAAALRRLAELDTAPLAAGRLPSEARSGQVLVAESDGALVAALSLADGLLVADPFARTAGVARLLRLHARELSRRTSRRPRLLGRLRARLV